MKVGNKNDLFIADRQSRNGYDFEGSGVGNGKYNENMELLERVKDSTLPIVLLIVNILFTVFFIKYASDYIYIVNHYTKAPVEKNIYGRDEARVPNGKMYKAYAVSSNNVVYYSQDNPENVARVPKMTWWILGGSVIVALYVLLIVVLYKTFHKTHYSRGNISSYDEDF